MTQQPKKSALWVGRVLNALVALMLLMSGSMKLTHSPAIVEQFVGKFGFPERTMTPIGILELSCVVLFVIPRTAILGAMMITAYLGGAVVTHVRVGDPFVIPVVLGIVVWVGLYLRDVRLRALFPLRSND